MSEHRAPLAAAIIVILGVATAPLYPYFLTISPPRDAKLEALDRELTELDMRVESANAAKRKYAQFQEEMARLDAENVKLRGIVPSDAGEEAFVKMLHDAAAASGVSVTVNARRPIVRDLWIELRHDVTVRGPLQNLERFFRQVANAPRIADAGHLELRREGTDWTASALLTSFSAEIH